MSHVRAPIVRDARVGCMTTFPPRFSELPRVVASLAPQLDALMIYVNGDPDGLPELSSWANVDVVRGVDRAGDLSATGKMYHLQRLENCYVFTVDDDFIYPPDYAEKMIALLDGFDRQCGVTVHGSLFPPRPRWYYERTQGFDAQKPLTRHQLVTLAGSGAFLFHQSTLPVRFEDFLPDVMVDLVLSREARRRGLPIFAIARPERWLRFLGGEGLWERFRRTITHHTVEARRHDWSFDVYRDLTLAMFERVFGRFDPDHALALGLDEALVGGLVSGRPPPPWRIQPLTFQRRRQHMELLLAQRRRWW